MSLTRIASAASAAILLGAFAIASASAMPLAPLQPAAHSGQVGPENVAWVCGPYRCWWRPGYRHYQGPRFYGPRPYRYGWHGHRRYW